MSTAGALPIHPHRPLLIGVIHLPPLPGSPRPSLGVEAVCAWAARDAETLRAGGADAVILENLGDAPFAAGAVSPDTLTVMTRAALEVRRVAPSLSLGINVLRNDARGALAIALAAQAQFIRVNVHTGAMVTDQGIIEGRARETLLERNRLGAPIAIAADIHVKHAAPLGAVQIEDAARDTWLRGGAEALIVSGSGTGQPTPPETLRRVRQAAPDAPLWIGSGITPDNLPPEPAQGWIVGTWLHRDGDLDQPIELERVRQMRACIAG